MNDKVKIRGWFDFECFNPDGSLAWKARIPNGTCTAGINDLFSVGFAAGTQKTTWYLGLIGNAGFSALSAADLINSHAGWLEDQNYTEGVRQTWTPGAPAGGVITNPTAASFTMNATTSIKGAFLVSNSTLGGTTGILWATGAFGTVKDLIAAQVLKVSYTCTGAGS